MSATTENGPLAVLLGYDPRTGKTTADPFIERPEDAGVTSPWHRAAALRDSLADDFPGWLWTIALNEAGRLLMAAENMRRWFGDDQTPFGKRECSDPECPGDGRYVPPGKGHNSGCLHMSIRPGTEGGESRG